MPMRILIPPGVARCTPRPITGRRLAAFADTASIEEIEEQLAARRAELRPLERHIEWLEDLLARRQEHVARGGRPPGTDRPA